MITVDHQKVLLDVARNTIEAVVNGRPHVPCAPSGDLAKPAAAFVSLHANGQLRGCIGHLDRDAPLVVTVAECARRACTSDPRFPGVTIGELEALSIEISVLGPFERVESVDAIVVGRHGLFVEHERRHGLLLPQVAAEYAWTAEVFLEHTCRKAGLPHDSWKRGAMIWRFEAQVFGD